MTMVKSNEDQIRPLIGWLAVGQTSLDVKERQHLWPDCVEKLHSIVLTSRDVDWACSIWLVHMVLCAAAQVCLHAALRSLFSLDWTSTDELSALWAIIVSPTHIMELLKPVIIQRRYAL